MESLGVLYTVYIKYVKFDRKIPLSQEKPNRALDHMPNALFTFVTRTSKENRYRATSGNTHSCIESFASLNAAREGFVCLFVLNINRLWQSGHGFI